MDYDDVLDKVNAIFTKYRKDKQKSVVDDFLSWKAEEYRIEKSREIDNDKNRT